MTCVQMGTIEFHGWGSPSWRRSKGPDRLVFDLDPDEGLGFEEVKRAARDLEALPRRHGACRPSRSHRRQGPARGGAADARGRVAAGARISPSASASRSRTGRSPSRFTANLAKAKRKGRIFLDYCATSAARPAIMPYCARAREGAPSRADQLGRARRAAIRRPMERARPCRADRARFQPRTAGLGRGKPDAAGPIGRLPPPARRAIPRRRASPPSAPST
jgi:hypothetical protein